MNPAPDVEDGAPGLQGRGLPLAAQASRRAGHPRSARRQAPPLREPTSRRRPAAARSSTSRRSHQTYHPDPVRAEEGGTPAIVESIRAGLVFGLKEEVGAATIKELEEGYVQRALDSWASEPEPLRARQPRRCERVAIVSFGIRYPLRGAAGRDAALELRRRAPRRPLRDPGAQRLLLRRAVRPPAARLRRGDVGRPRGGGPARLRRGSSSPSCASPSTTSSARPSSSTSSTRSTSSPTTPGSSCPSTASTRGPASGTTANARGAHP